MPILPARATYLLDLGLVLRNSARTRLVRTTSTSHLVQSANSGVEVDVEVACENVITIVLDTVSFVMKVTKDGKLRLTFA